jgi:hypothetical protein
MTRVSELHTTHLKDYYCRRVESPPSQLTTAATPCTLLKLSEQWLCYSDNNGNVINLSTMSNYLESQKRSL